MKLDYQCITIEKCAGTAPLLHAVCVEALRAIVFQRRNGDVTPLPKIIVAKMQPQPGGIRDTQLPPSKIDIDDKARFRYLDSYRSRVFDASICCAVADAGTQFTFFDSSAPEKQLLIFFSLTIGCPLDSV